MFANYSVVNGQVWPYLRVEPTRYRFRILNACNSRVLRLFFALDLPNEDALDGDCSGSPTEEKRQARERVNVTMVGSDGGLLREPANTGSFWMTPAERYDLVIDFSPFAGRNVTLHNDGPVELGLPWRCPPNCSPDFGTGPDRWVRFVVGMNTKDKNEGETTGEKRPMETKSANVERSEEDEKHTVDVYGSYEHALANADPGATPTPVTPAPAAAAPLRSSNVTTPYDPLRRALSFPHLRVAHGGTVPPPCALPPSHAPSAVRFIRAPSIACVRSC
jgi:FtsP/CotA-like multicopper oxidase with cupredoxin domain